MTIIPPWVYAAGAAATVALSFGAGWQVRSWRCDAQVAAIERRLVEARDAAQARRDNASTTYEQNRAVVATEARTAPPTVRTIYRDLPPVPTACEPNSDALRVLDTALARTGTAAGEPVAAVP